MEIRASFLCLSELLVQTCFQRSAWHLLSAQSPPQLPAPQGNARETPWGVTQVKFSVGEERPSWEQQKSGLGVWRTDHPAGWAGLEWEPVCSEQSRLPLSPVASMALSPLPQLLAVLARCWEVRGAARAVWISRRKNVLVGPGQHRSEAVATGTIPFLTLGTHNFRNTSSVLGISGFRNKHHPSLRLPRKNAGHFIVSFNFNGKKKDLQSCCFEIKE